MYLENRKAINLTDKLDHAFPHPSVAVPQVYSRATLDELFFNEAQSFQSVPTGCISKACVEANCIVADPKHWSWGEQHVHPEADAVLFYLINQYFSVLGKRFAKYELITDPMHRMMVGEAVTRLVRLQLRAFYYLTVICTREARHSKFSAEELEGYIIGRGVPKPHAVEFAAFFKEIKGSGSEATQKAFYSSDLNLPFGWYTKCLVYTFETSFSAAYGGAAWKNIAECLDRAIWGVTSFLTMVDTSYTLAHNTGAIFNKGFIYFVQDKHLLLRILDLQRAGALPEAWRTEHIAKKVKKRATSTEDIANINFIEVLMEAFYALSPEHDKFINWENVINLGALGDYSEEVKAQMISEKTVKSIQVTMPDYTLAGTLHWHPKKTPLKLLKRIKAA